MKRNPLSVLNRSTDLELKSAFRITLAALVWSLRSRPERSLWLLTCSVIAPFKERFRFASVLSKRFCNRFPTANIDFFFGLADDYFLQFRPIYNMTPFEFRVRFFGMIGSGSVIRTHSDHGRSNEPMNPCLEWTHRFIWSTMIRVISITDTDPDHPKGTHPWYPFCVRSLCPSKLIPQRQVTCHFKSFFFLLTRQPWRKRLNLTQSFDILTI